MEKGEYFKETTELYELSTEIGSGKLIIFLRTDNKMWRNSYTNGNLPSEVERQIGKIQIIFQILKSKANYEANPFEGEIKLRTFLEINNKKYQKTATLYLDQVQLDNWESLYRQMSDIRKRISKIDQREEEENLERMKKLKDIERQNFQLKLLVEEMKQTVDNQEEQLKIIDHQLKKQRKEKKQFEKRFQIAEENIKLLMQNAFTSINKNSRLLEEETKQIEKVSRIKKEEKPKDSLFDTSTPYANRFYFEGNCIAYKGQDKVTTQLVMKTPIAKYKIERIFFTVIKTHFKNILVGVTDRRYKKARKSSNTRNAVCYFGYNGLIVYGNMQKGKFKQEGNGFKEGEHMCMEINLKQGSIKWKKQDQVKASISLEYLKEDDKEFVPFIELRNKGDIVEWKKEESLL